MVCSCGVQRDVAGREARRLRHVCRYSLLLSSVIIHCWFRQAYASALSTTLVIVIELRFATHLALV